MPPDQPADAADFAAARARYAAVLRAACTFALDDLAPYLGAPCALTRITARVLGVWRTTWLPVAPPHAGAGGWDWARIVAAQPRSPDNLDLAIWSGDVLCGLMVGRPSRSRTRLLLELVEGAPFVPHPLQGRVLDVSLLVAEYYARGVGARRLRLMNPLRGMQGRYIARYGFGPAVAAGRQTYQEREVTG
jgi:hypothetical protein